VIFEAEQEDDHRRKPHEPRRQRKPDPDCDVPDIERVSDPGERAARDQRPQPIGARPRNGADVMDAPHPKQLAGDRDGDADGGQRRGRRRLARPKPKNSGGNGKGKGGAVSKQPAAEPGRRVEFVSHVYPEPSGGA